MWEFVLKPSIRKGNRLYHSVKIMGTLALVRFSDSKNMGGSAYPGLTAKELLSLSLRMYKYGLLSACAAPFFDCLKTGAVAIEALDFLNVFSYSGSHFKSVLSGVSLTKAVGF